MKVSELEGAELDFFVAKAECIAVVRDERKSRYVSNGYAYDPSYSWDQGGPIVERERITLLPCGKMIKDGIKSDHWVASVQANINAHGRTALEAAMRAYVSSKFGDEVPDEPEKKNPTD